MVRLVKMECTSCGGTLKREGINTYICPYCGTHYKLDRDIVVPVDKKSKKKNEKKGEVRGENKTAVFGILALLLVLLVVLVLIAVLIDEKPSGKPGSVKPTVNVGSENKALQSPYYKEFVAKAFGKPAEEVSREELAEVTTLAINKSNKYLIEYRIGDGELQTAELTAGLKKNNGDLKLFTGLKVLEYDSDHFDMGELAYMPELEELTCKSAPSEVLKSLKEPEKLKKLSCEYYSDKGNLGEINRFFQLECLILDIHHSMLSGNEKTSFEGIRELQGLKEFYLDSEDCLTADFLSNAKGLKTVTLHCDNLKDISFVKNTPDLEALSLDNCDILSIKELKYTPKLKVLRLYSCSKLDGYEILPEFKDLEELMFSYYYGQSMPESFASLTKLTSLRIDGVKDVSFLAELPSLKHLEMFGCICTHFDVAENLTELEELRMRSGSDYYNLKVLTKLKKLEKVDVSGLTANCDIESLFLIPNIKELNFNNSEQKIDLNVVKRNESIEVLKMDNLKWQAFNTTEGDRIYDYENWTKLPMNDCIGFLANFPNLRVLSVEGNELEQLDFVKSLPKLVELNVTNNYISDLSALHGLKDLKTVSCGENPLSKDENMDPGVMVNYDSQARKEWPFYIIEW